MERLQQQFVYSYYKDEQLPSSYRAVFNWYISIIRMESVLL